MTDPDAFDLLGNVSPDHRSGFVATVGRPNVGKSTLVNACVGHKVSIVSSKPQTTRNRIQGILTREDAQVIFVDLPGIHHPKHRLGKHMVNTATRSLADADMYLFVVDVSTPSTPEDEQVAQLLSQRREEKPILLILNKMDRLAPADVIHRTEAYASLVPDTEEILLSALHGDNLDMLLKAVVSHLPQGPRYFPPDQFTDQPERFLVTETVREAALRHLHQEVPHAVAVVADQFKERENGILYLEATVYIEKDSQKRILIGRGGSMLKQIGQEARRELEHSFDTHIFLELWVKVRPNWRRSEREMRHLGYDST